MDGEGGGCLNSGAACRPGAAGIYFPRKLRSLGFSMDGPFFLNVGLFLFFFLPFRAAPVAYGGSQARGRIGATAAGLGHSHSRIQAVSATYTTAHCNSRSLTH